MGRYVIRYEKYGCIGAAVCEIMDPKNWKMNEAKTKADLIEGIFNKDNSVWEKEIGEEDLEKAIAGAEACPVKVIRIFNKETGERIV